MNMKLIPLIATLTLLLSSCNLFNVFPGPSISVELVATSEGAPNLNSTQIIVNTSVDPDTNQIGFAVNSVRLKAFSQAGSTSSTIESYAIDYFYATNDEIPTSTGQSFRGSLSLIIPDGVRCKELPPEGDAEDCTINSLDEAGKPDYVFERSADVFSSSFVPIDLDIINALYFGTTPRNGAYATIVLEGKDANGNIFTHRLSPVTIEFLAAEGG